MHDVARREGQWDGYAQIHCRRRLQPYPHWRHPFALFFSGYAKRTCFVHVDPLDPLWPMRHLLQSGPATSSSSGLKRDSGAGGGSACSGRIVASSSESSRRESTSSEDSARVSLADLGQGITPPRQPRLGRLGSGSPASPIQGGSRRIRLQSPVSFPLIDDGDEGSSPTPRCVSRRISFRSPIVDMPDTPDDDLWIGIEEDLEERIGRFMPHGSATFEGLKSYPREIL